MIESLPPRSTRVADIVTRISQMISRGALKPGDFLPPQRELADQLGVGANTLREAVQTLIGIGLLESHPGKGTWVRQDALDAVFQPAAVKARLGELDVWMIYETRQVLEVAVAGFAAQRATVEDIQRIWDTQRAAEEAVGDLERFVPADMEFHRAVAEASHNDLLTHFFYLVHKLLFEFLLELSALPRIKECGLGYQRVMAQAIEAHDVEKARAAATELMEEVRRALEAAEQTSPLLRTSQTIRMENRGA